jgi:tetratricopeptide (TPR) repeat protein
MKVAHLESTPGESVRERIAHARELESQGDYKAAEKMYLRLVKNKLTNTVAYNRLMIIYRKQKQYQKEIEIIDQAIEMMEQSVTRETDNKKIRQLSLSLGKSMGLVDRKGLSVFDPEPVATWKKRKLMATKLFKKKKK